MIISLALLPCAHLAAADLPLRALDQMHHTAWTTRDGAPPDIWAIAQSRDGLLWLGTGAGLYSFDGIRFEAFRPAPGEAMPATNINALHVSRNGDLWIGFNTGAVARLRGGHITSFDLGLPRVPVLEMAEDSNGAVWAALGDRQLGGLAFYAHGRWTVADLRWGLPEGSATSVMAARDGSVWAAVANTLAVLRPGAARFVAVPASASDAPRLTQDPAGHIWLSTGSRPGLQRLPTPSEGRKPAFWIQPPAADVSRAESLRFARDGTLWGTYGSGGVFRMAGAAQARLPRSVPTQTFGLRDGLTSDLANPILEDREGNIWIGTNFGLDQFRKTSVAAAPGIPFTSRRGFLVQPGEAGSMYVATTDALYRAFPQAPAVRIAALSRRPGFLFVDATRRVWVEFEDGVARITGNRLVEVPLPQGISHVAGWSREGVDLCFRALTTEQFCWRHERWEQTPSPLRDDHVRSASTIHDGAGHTWLLFDGRLALEEHGALRVMSSDDGLTVGNIETTFVGKDALYVGGDFGLARFDGHRFTTLRSDRHQGLTRISGLAQDADGTLWINGLAGIVSIARGNLARAFAHPDGPLGSWLFAFDDGVPGAAQQDSLSNTAVAASDGRIWFVTSRGVAWIDPRHLVRNSLPPPVIIGALTSGHAAYAPDQSGTVLLPKGTANLQIGYTAPSLSVPRRVHFRYRLDEIDSDWVDPGGRREAFYTALPPGTYHFSVIAANNDGVWNTVPARLTFTIPPTFVQSIWFKAFVAILCSAALWLLYVLRVRQIAGRLRALHQERLSERERIARELHDTLLQAFQGLVFHFQALADQLPRGNHRQSMERALDLADNALIEGRDRVANLRDVSGADDLTEALAQALAQDMTGFAGDFRILTEGAPRDLEPIVREEVIRIGEEAVANALRHARSDRIEIGILYEARGLTVAFRDEGIGIDRKVLASGRREGHFGMIGMHERARKIHGELAITSEPGMGTEVTLTVPASIAYSQAQTRRWWRREPMDLEGAAR